jgi:hypothetical protein
MADGWKCLWKSFRESFHSWPCGVKPRDQPNPILRTNVSLHHSCAAQVLFTARSASASVAYEYRVSNWRLVVVLL